MLLAWKLRSSISTNMAPDVLNLLLNAEERECCLLFQATMNGAHHQAIKALSCCSCLHPFSMVNPEGNTG